MGKIDCGLIYVAKSLAHDISVSANDEMIYKLLCGIVREKTYEGFFDIASKRNVTFSSLEDFLTSAEGLGVPDLSLFLGALEGVARLSGAIPDLAKKTLVLMREAGLSCLALQSGAAQPLAAHGEIGNGRADESRGDNGTSTRGSNSQAYLLSRLARDRPDILERVKAGEFKSARAAAIEAGIVKDVPVMRLAAPEKAAASILERMGEEWAAQLTNHLTTLLTG